ncbi:hypothetical protein [Aridibaculum aurantiacum]|uniref:hypothetical protein n=1 Tax=Aridibaculum aurantiacum TaxID=2810307 RepID=UPI001A961755|nr:hypothetical protein [Aridibaculum aurantiacum]
MDIANDAFAEDNNQSHSTESGGKVTPQIHRDKADEKLTLEEEADLTPHEIAEMERQHANEAYKGSKGSSGPEEKDIAV